MGYLLGIDIGTSGCKIGLFTADGTPLFQSAHPYKTIYPDPGYAEQDPEEWWRAVCHTVRRMLAETGMDGKRIRAIGVDGQSGSALPVDRAGNPLRHAMIWFDRRSAKQCEEMRRNVDEEELFRISGNPVSPSYTTPKMLWMKEKEPELYKKTFKFLQSNSYIVYKLTGVFTHDYSQGNGIHAFDIEKRQWNVAFCEQLGIRPELLPDLYECSAVVGEVTAEAAEQTGLPKGIPVVAGGLDAACATLGAGAVRQGQIQEQGGQAGGMSIVLDRAVKDEKLILSCHVVPGKWILQGGTVGGGSLNWFRREFACAADDQFYEAVNKEAARIPAGSEGLLFLPYMAGERSPIWDVHAKGMFLGLDYEKTRGHMARAIMEGCAYALWHNLLTAEQSGVNIGVLHSVGGAANSELWTQIKADVTGKTFNIPSSDAATTLGAALIAGVGVGMYRDFDDAVKQTIRITRTHEPDEAAHMRYKRLFPLYLETYERLKDLFPRLGEEGMRR